MKLIQSLDISEGISMDSLKPIINAEAESSFDSCLEIKDATIDDHLPQTEKRLQSNLQNDKSLTDIDVESIGNNPKKMFEKVDLNSSDAAIKKDSWNSGTVYHQTSEKENMGEINEVRFDYTSDDENASLHLRVSSDEDNSLEAADIEKNKLCSMEDHNKLPNDMSEDTDITEIDNVDRNEAKICSMSDSGAELKTKELVVSSSQETEENESSLACQDPTTSSDSTQVSSTDDFECTPSCSKSISEENSPKKENEETSSLRNGEKNMHLDEKTNYTKISQNSIHSPLLNDECSVSSANISENEAEMSVDDSKEINLEDDKKDSVPNHLDQILTCDGDVGFDSSQDSDKRCMLPKTKSEGSGSHRIEGCETGRILKDIKDKDERPFSEKSSNHLDLNENNKIEKDQSSNLLEQLSENSSKITKNSDSKLKLDDLDSKLGEADLASAEGSLRNKDAHPLIEDEPKRNSVSQEMNIDQIINNDTSAQSISNSETAEEFMDCSESTGRSTSDQPTATNKALPNSNFSSSSNEDFTKTGEISDETEDNVCQKHSTEGHVKKRHLLPSSKEVPASRKRTSTSCDEKIDVSSKRSKVSVNDNEDSDLVRFEDTSSEHVSKNKNVMTKDNAENKENESASSIDNMDNKKGKEASNAKKEIEKMAVCVSDEEKEESAKSGDMNSDSKRELENTETDKVNPLPFLRNLSRSQLQSMTRNDLEELVLQKICEAITERSVSGELREVAVSLDQKLKAWQKKSFQLTKQVKDLNLVLKRFGSDLQNKGPNSVPVKITRSVGLQVQFPGSASNLSWNQDDPSWRKGDKAPVSTPTPTTPSKPGMNALPKTTTPSSPAAKVAANSPASQKVAENSKGCVSPPLLQNSESPSTSAKVLQTKSPTTPTTTVTTTSSSSKSSLKQVVSSINNRLKSASDLQVIDLTDAEEKSKSNNSQTTSSPATDTTSTIVTSVNSSPVSSVGCRSIRVVQHLGSTSASPLLTQTVTTAVAGPRVAYYVPTTTAVPQRQLIISNPPVRPPGVVVSHRQNSIPALVLKPGSMVPVTGVPVSSASIIRPSTALQCSTNALQLARPQPRATHYLQRIPVTASPVQTTAVSSLPQHPAPLPPTPTTVNNNANWKLSPPKPDLKISRVPNRNQQGIVLSWNMTVSSEYEEIASYQLFAYQEGTAPPSTQLWKKVGDVKALPLPMACTLTQFMEGHKYHFAVRAVDVYARYGPFSSPGNIVLTRN